MIDQQNVDFQFPRAGMDTPPRCLHNATRGHVQTLIECIHFRKRDVQLMAAAQRNVAIRLVTNPKERADGLSATRNEANIEMDWNSNTNR